MSALKLGRLSASPVRVTAHSTVSSPRGPVREPEAGLGRRPHTQTSPVPRGAQLFLRTPPNKAPYRTLWKGYGRRVAVGRPCFRRQWSHRPDVASGGTRARPPQAQDRSSARAKPRTLGRISKTEAKTQLSHWSSWRDTVCGGKRRVLSRSAGWTGQGPSAGTQHGADHAKQGAVHAAAPELCSSGSRMYVCGQGRPQSQGEPRSPPRPADMTSKHMGPRQMPSSSF
ncbi:uncharacterized protein LOC132015487 [Mustela nigripes]|uniref:uncharacterized protein LOC132015487 n=1 Tax=Mustela nigripes TaxID=77151 RepID=UPI002815E4D4|nr:uncharacterized protein LOC132015487 [Mustela nigripes]